MMITVGLDVHKDSTSICFYKADRNEVLFTGKIETETRAIVKSVERCRKQLRNEEVDFLLGYEAGFLGYPLAKELNASGYPCVVMAPDSIYAGIPNRRVKNDARDAQAIARALAYGQYSSVEIPSDEDLDAREIVRRRFSLVEDLTRIKNSANSLVLRNGYKYNKRYWTKVHLKWLKQLELPQYARLTLDNMIAQIEYLQDSLKFMESYVEAISKDKRYAEKVSKLRCFYGIDTLTAITLLVEIGDFSRFPNANSFASYIGLLPGEKSSGNHYQNTGITNMGNKLSRTLLVECAQQVTKNKPEYKSERMREKQKGVDPKAVAYADRYNRRAFHLAKKYRENRAQPNKAKIAIAHELACFVWGMMTDHME